MGLSGGLDFGCAGVGHTHFGGFFGLPGGPSGGPLGSLGYDGLSGPGFFGIWILLCYAATNAAFIVA